MDEMIGYIFSSLKTSEVSIKNIRRILQSQARFNHSVNTINFAIIVYIVITMIRENEQNKKIKSLEDKLEELKH